MSKCRPWNLWVSKRYVTVWGRRCLDAAAILFLLLQKKKSYPTNLILFGFIWVFPPVRWDCFFWWKTLCLKPGSNLTSLLGPSCSYAPIVSQSFLHLVPFFANLFQMVWGSCSSDVSSGDELLSWLFFSPSGIIKSHLSPYWPVLV